MIRSMAAMIKIGSNFTLLNNVAKDGDHEQHQQIQHHGVVIDEIEGLIKVYKDGYVERPPILPCVTPTLAPELGVTSQDVVIDKLTNVWARFYVPSVLFNGVTNNKNHNYKLPLLVYFHGGGFCVGSAAWSRYHEFLARIAIKAGCVIMSINYRLAPENPLPAAFDDGVRALLWLKQVAVNVNGINNNEHLWWSSKCDFSKIFLVGDSAGANIAYNVVTRLYNSKSNIVSIDSCEAKQWILNLKPLLLKGIILIQPFFGGEARTNHEKYSLQPPRSALTLPASDTYWRLALPCGANRDHRWCNPLSSRESMKVVEEMGLAVMVCTAEMDILRDRNLEFVAALRGNSSKGSVEHVVHGGVGHAFQVLSKSQLAQSRTLEVMSQIKTFITKYS